MAVEGGIKREPSGAHSSAQRLFESYKNEIVIVGFSAPDVTADTERKVVVIENDDGAAVDDVEALDGYEGKAKRSPIPTSPGCPGSEILPGSAMFSKSTTNSLSTGSPLPWSLMSKIL